MALRPYDALTSQRSLGVPAGEERGRTVGAGGGIGVAPVEIADAVAVAGRAVCLHLVVHGAIVHRVHLHGAWQRARRHMRGDGIQSAGHCADAAAGGGAAASPGRRARGATPVSGLSALTVRSGLGSGRPAALGGGVAGASGLATGRT
ncbi:hypothetical protein G6F40_015885 [Rhizopus arrhizus]|nr:hypothetical protein G6F40_015885 [Rhizopus arrhizus]